MTIEWWHTSLKNSCAESWWGFSNSDSGLLIDSDSDSNSRSDTKYKINNTLVGRVSAVQTKKINVTFRIDFGFPSFGRDIYTSYHTCLSDRICPFPQKERIVAARSIICSDYVQIICGAGASPRRRPAWAGTVSATGAASLRRREGRLEKWGGHFLNKKTTTWFDMTNHLPSHFNFGFGWSTIFVKKKKIGGKWEGHQWRIQKEGPGRGQISNRYPNFWKFMKREGLGRGQISNRYPNFWKFLKSNQNQFACFWTNK